MSWDNGRDSSSPQARLRLEHERTILRAITSQDVVSRTQLAADHGLSGQSIGRIVRDLLDDGLIEEGEVERSRSGPGAPRIGLRIRPDGAFALGFGLERDRVTGVVLDLGSTVRWQTSRSTSPGEAAIETLQRIEKDARSALDSAEFSGRLCGLGIATPGPLDFTTGTIVGAPNFPSWQHVDVAAELGGSLGLPVVVDNASTAAAIGTKWQLHRGPTPFIYCYWGVGIGGGLVVDDEAYRGTTGNTMEIGHVVVAPGGWPCGCGGAGCLEAEASVAAILRDAARFGEFLTVESVVAAAGQSDPLKEILVNAAEKMATALLSVVNLVDIDEVIIGGEHFRAVEHVFLPIIRDRLATQSFRRRISLTTVTVNTLEAANAVGAAALVLHNLLPSPASRRPAVHRPTSRAVVQAGRRRRPRSPS